MEPVIPLLPHLYTGKSLIGRIYRRCEVFHMFGYRLMDSVLLFRLE